jgi:uncharacterized protein (DUF3084 family)
MELLEWCLLGSTIFSIIMMFIVRSQNKRIFTLKDIRDDLKFDVEELTGDRDWWEKQADINRNDLMDERNAYDSLRDSNSCLQKEVQKLRDREKKEFSDFAGLQHQMGLVKKERDDAIYRVDVLEAALQLKKQM